LARRDAGAARAAALEPSAVESTSAAGSGTG
jgi:hypothetical protein